MAGNEERPHETEQGPAPKTRSWRRVSMVVAVPVFLLLIGFAVDRARSSGQVLRGVTIGGIAATGASPDVLTRRIRELEGRMNGSTVAVRVQSKVFHLQPARFGFTVDVDASVKRAMARGRGGGVWSQFGWWLGRWLSVESVPLSARLDQELLAALVDELETEAIAEPPHAGGIKYEGGEVQVVAPRAGPEIDRASLPRLLLDAAIAADGSVVEAPLVTVTPQTSHQALDAAAKRAVELTAAAVRLTSEDGQATFTLERAQLGASLRAVVHSDTQVSVGFEPDAIAQALTKLRLQAPPKDARIEIDDKNRPRVVPSRSGSVLSPARVAEALELAALAPARQGVLPLLQGAEPAVDTDALLSLNIKGLVSKFTTFHACCQPRVDNIHRIADLMTGVIVPPGEYFSVNAHVGPRTTKNGFVAAPTIEEGEMVDALGGGASQFATTIFNALFYGGYDIIERQPHSYYFPRYPMGIEATLSFPKPDIIFRNDTSAGMLFRCRYTDTSITVEIFGDNGGRKVRATRGQNFAIQKPPLELIANDEIEPEREKVKEAGQIGWSVIVGRVVTFADGSKKEEKRKVIYSPRVRRVEVHSCKIPEGEEGHTGLKCPEPDGGVEAGASEVVEPN